jgi:CheY-like chemotaxis protein
VKEGPLPAAHTILLIEDDEALRRILCRLLDGQGYHVVCAGTAIEAIQLATDPENHIDLLLTDVGLPGASGYQLAGVLLRLRGDLLVIFMSGREEADISEPPPSGRRLPHLLKPFTMEHLLDLLRVSLRPPAQGIADAG